MCIKCIEARHLDKKIEYKDYRGPTIYIRWDKNQKNSPEHYNGKKFPGWTPQFIDIKLIGLYRVRNVP